MKWLSTIVLSFIVLISSSVAQPRLSLSGGFASPAKPTEFNEYWSSGAGFTGAFAIPISPAAFMTVDISYSGFPLNEDKFDAPGVSITGGSISIVTFHVGLKSILSNNLNTVSLFIVGSGGYFKIAVDGMTVSGGGLTLSTKDDDEAAFSFSVGGGVTIPLSQAISLFLEARYAMGFTEGDKTGYIPLRTGIEFALE